MYDFQKKRALLYILGCFENSINYSKNSRFSKCKLRLTIQTQQAFAMQI